MNAKLIIKMEGATTTIINPDSQEPKTFTFDYSYWSHDGFTVDENQISVPDGPSSDYADQKRVFNDIGVEILNNAFNGITLSSVLCPSHCSLRN